MKVTIEYLVGNKAPIVVEVDEQDYDALLEVVSTAGCYLAVEKIFDVWAENE